MVGVRGQNTQLYEAFDLKIARFKLSHFIKFLNDIMLLNFHHIAIDVRLNCGTFTAC